MPTTVVCPRCKKEVIWDQASEFRPFCSERCRLQDLGAWFMEEHSIKGESVDGTEEIFVKQLEKNDSSSEFN